MKEDCVLLEKLRKLQRVVHVLSLLHIETIKINQNPIKFLLIVKILLK